VSTSRPTRARQVTVAALLAAASTGHVIYPAGLAWATRGHPKDRRAPRDDGAREWPHITVLVPAYREAGIIASKVEDVRANGYSGLLDVLVIADGDLETAQAAEAAGARTVTAPERLGKSQALNRGFAEAGTPIVVISDANNRLLPGALDALVRPFDDPHVGAVAGEKLEDDGGGGESLYWRFESWLKGREDQLGTTIGLVGELSAIRAEAWRPIPADIATDDLWAGLDIIEQGYRVAYAPTARAVEPPGVSLPVQWERRIRSVSGALHVFNRRRYQLRPSAGLVAVEIWGHRLARYTVGPFAHLALLVVAVRRVRRSRAARLFLLGHAVAAWALAREAGRVSGGSASNETVSNETVSNETVQQPLGVVEAAAAGAGQVLFLQGVALAGVVRYLRGDRRTQWSTVER
jgi:poly-beta-1,6-N-acetyl-D-glucosamine synthase